MYKALVLDIGDVITDLLWKSLDDFERVTGRSGLGRGPLDPDGDPIWRRHVAGEIDIGAYWDEVAARQGYADWKVMYREIADSSPQRFSDPDAVALMSDAREAGFQVAVLTNDGVSITGRQFFESRPEFQALDAFVDARAFDQPKPLPESYLRTARVLGVDPSEVVFLDNTPDCVEGARDVGMTGVLVDPLDKLPAFDRARQLLRIGQEARAWRLVRAAERAYRAADLDQIMQLFHPEIVIYWNGERVASGHAEARRFHVDKLGIGRPTNRRDIRLSKTLRVAAGDTIGVEWETSHIDSGGGTVLGSGGEFWTMNGDLVIEWHAHFNRRPA
ncbi:MAG: HAD-IA family hydrolase [Ilumatobacteraceae bacterium]